MQLSKYTITLLYISVVLMTHSMENIQQAIIKGDIRSVRSCIKKNPQCLTVQNESGNTLLHLAIDNKQIKIAHLIMSIRGLDINQQNNLGNTPLHVTSFLDIPEILRALLGYPSIDTNKPNFQGNTALHLAVLWGNTEAANLLLTHPEVEIDPRNASGKTPLHLAASQDHEKMMRLLLLNGANPQIKDKIGDKPADHYSYQCVRERLQPIFTCFYEAQRAFIMGIHPQTGAGSIINILNIPAARCIFGNLLPKDFEKMGETISVMQSAVEKSDLETLSNAVTTYPQWLNIRDHYGQTLLHRAIRYRKPEVVTLLLKNTAIKVNIQDHFSNTPLHLAASDQNSELVRLLLDHPNITIDKQSTRGITPLMIALRLKIITNAHLLLLHGADPTITDKRGCRPLDLPGYQLALEKVIYDARQQYTAGKQLKCSSYLTNLYIIPHILGFL